MHLNSYLEELRGEVLEPLIENLASNPCFDYLLWTFDFSHLSKEAIVHLNSYLEKLRGEVLEPLIGNLASLLVLS